MPLTTNLQRTVALALREGYGISLPDSYFEGREHFLSEDGLHVGDELLWDLENQDFVNDTVERSKEWIRYGYSQYEELLHAASDPTRTLHELIILWGEMFRTLYHGALDHVVPFDKIILRIAELAELAPEDPLLSSICTPTDGKTWLFHHDLSLLLHLAYSFRKCSLGLQINSYDGYTKGWLDLNYLAPSIDQAINLSADPTQDGIRNKLRDLGVPSDAYYRSSTREDNECYFRKVREGLTYLGNDRITWAWRAQTAQEAILERCSELTKENVQSLLTVIGPALQYNEEIHHRVYLGLNVLRLAAQARGESAIPLSRAFIPRLEYSPGCHRSFFSEEL